MKNKNVKSRREALEKQKLQVKLESIHNKKIRINAFKEKNKEQKIQRQWLQVIPIVQSYNKFLNAFHRIRQHNANQILLEERHRAATILQNQSNGDLLGRISSSQSLAASDIRVKLRRH